MAVFVFLARTGERERRLTSEISDGHTDPVQRERQDSICMPLKKKEGMSLVDERVKAS